MERSHKFENDKYINRSKILQGFAFSPVAGNWKFVTFVIFCLSTSSW